MTKAELVEEVARAAELNKRDAEVIVETVFDSIISTLHRGEKVELRGFGSFRTRERGPRRGRNPKTGQPVDVPAKRVPYFKPGKELKEYFTDEPEATQPDHSPEPDHSHEQPAEAAAPAVEAPPAVEEAASASPEVPGGSSTDGFGSHGQ
jgi:integration host factor subunit beta